MQRCSSTKCSEWVGTARRGNLRGPSHPALQHAARAMGRRTVVRYDGGEERAGAATHWPGTKWAPEPHFHWWRPRRALGDGFSKGGVTEHLGITIPRCRAIKFGTRASKNGGDRTRDAKMAREKDPVGVGFDRGRGFWTRSKFTTVGVIWVQKISSNLSTFVLCRCRPLESD